jgi:hypothetical protein
MKKYKCPRCKSKIDITEVEDYVIDGKNLCSPCLDEEIPKYNLEIEVNNE